MLLDSSKKNQTVGGQIKIYILFRLVYVTFKFRLTPRSSISSLKIRMTSHPCNKYEQIMLSYLLSVNYNQEFISGLFSYVISFQFSHSGIVPSVSKKM